jgi:hypothetical protein
VNTWGTAKALFLGVSVKVFPEEIGMRELQGRFALNVRGTIQSAQIERKQKRTNLLSLVSGTETLSFLPLDIRTLDSSAFGL